METLLLYTTRSENSSSGEVLSAVYDGRDEKTRIAPEGAMVNDGMQSVCFARRGATCGRRYGNYLMPWHLAAKGDGQLQPYFARLASRWTTINESADGRLEGSRAAGCTVCRASRRERQGCGSLSHDCHVLGGELLGGGATANMAAFYCPLFVFCQTTMLTLVRRRPSSQRATSLGRPSMLSRLDSLLGTCTGAALSIAAAFHYYYCVSRRRVRLE